MIWKMLSQIFHHVLPKLLSVEGNEYIWKRRVKCEMFLKLSKIIIDGSTATSFIYLFSNLIRSDSYLMCEL